MDPVDGRRSRQLARQNRVAVEGSEAKGLPPVRVLGWPAFSNRAEQPYNWLLYTHLRRAGVEVEEYSPARVLTGRWDILHLHWPDRRVRDRHAAAALLRSGALLALLDAARARGMKVVWTAHNIAAHEGTYHERLEPRYWRALTQRLDAVIAMSVSGAAAVRDRFAGLRETPVFVIPHGHYRGVYPDEVTRTDARRTLALRDDVRVFAFVGQVRGYKNVQGLVDAFRALDEQDVALVIAGRPKPPTLEAEIRARSAGDPRICFDARFIPDDQLQIPLRAADLVVLPYRDVLNSGSAILALSFDRPVLVPRIGAMGDLARTAGENWIRTYDGELTADTLRGALHWVAERSPGTPDLSGLEWNGIATLTAAAFRTLMGPGRRGPPQRLPAH